LEDYTKKENGVSALDIGTGSGYLAQSLSSTFSFVVSTDINFTVLKKQMYPQKNLICCNGADAITFRFDLVVCNLPYLATDEILDIATDGGLEGLEIPMKIIHSVSNCVKIGGKFLFITSSLSNYLKLMEFTEKEGFSVKLLGRKKLFFEELIVIEAKK